MQTPKRYRKNENMLTPEENQSLRDKKVAVIGCGGLGGHIIEQLARLGIGHITALDGDVFDETNLNRQLLSSVDNIGKSKALSAFHHIKKVNPEVEVSPHQIFMKEENAEQLLEGHDVLCDALDNIPSRILLQKTARQLGIPMVYGAIAGWYGQVTTIFPEDDMLESMWTGGQEKGIEQQLGNPSFTPALVASIQVSEVLKILTGKGRLLRKKFLMIDTLEQEFEVFEF